MKYQLRGEYMIDFEELIINTGLIITKVNEYNGQKIYEADNLINDICNSKYLIMNTSRHILEEMLDVENYIDYENKVLKPVFYNAKGDLSWNLYVIIVLDEKDYGTINKDIVIQFEKNDRFARKMIVSIKQFLDVIPIGKTVHSDSGKIDINPVSDWIDILHGEGMTFCLEEYSNPKYLNFIKGKNVGSDVKKGKVSKSEEETDVHKIETIRLTDVFRDHCYGKNRDIDVGTVNLLYGSNGSGKTSLLEAIELVVTGNVRKKIKKDNQNVEDDISSGIVLGMEGGDIWEIPTKSSIRKKRETSFYQNRESNLGKDALNKVFHRYNYFSFEDVFMFTFLDEQPEFALEFSKIIFGEDIKRIEKNLSRYHDEFKNNEKQLKARREEYKASIDKLLDEIRTSSEGKIDTGTLNEMMKDLMSDSLESIPNNEIDNIKVWIEKCSEIVNYSFVRFEFLINSDAGLDSLIGAKEKIEKITGNLEQLDIEVNTKRKGVDEFKKSRDIQITRIAELDAQRTTLERQTNALLKQKNEFSDKVMKLKDFARCKKIQDITQTLVELKVEIDFGTKLKYRWGYLTKVALEDVIDREILAADLIKSNEIIENINYEIKKIDKDIELQEKLNSELHILISEIQSLGRSYVHKKDDAMCPLCNHKYLTQEELLFAISNSDSKDSSVLAGMYSMKKGYTDRLNEQNGLIKKAKEKATILDDIVEVFTLIPCDVISNEKFKESKKLSIVKEYFEEFENKRTALESQEDELELLINEVYSLENIDAAISICNEYIGVLNTELTEHNVEVAMALVTDSINKAKENLDGLFNDINKNNEIREISENNYKEQSQVLKQLIDEREYLFENRNMLEKIIDEVKTIIASGISIKEYDSWKIKYEKLKRLKEKIEIELISLNQLQYTDLQKNNLNELQNKYDVVNNELIICRRAMRVLNTLTPSSEYAKEFIESNIEGISNLFGSLHFPREFDSLGLNQNSELVGYRGTGSDRKEVPVHLMSTGQRTAVVLSVFFRFFNSLDTVPKFILLDEPVSNIDDLNTLALFDFLRELTLDKKCQVFFTTANYQVAKLFRRKFSFLRDEFHSLKFERNGNSKTCITREYFTEYSDSIINEEVVF